ncbi:MAG TPA: hypothetical protein VKK81_08500 [Candidatus Binatia bacterium]|nr:hypothetical protein [Candidatus Binatia bacterium]
MVYLWQKQYAHTLTEMERAITLDPDNAYGYAYAWRAEASEVLRLNPQFSLEVHKQRMPIKDPAVLERHIEALRKVGLK